MTNNVRVQEVSWDQIRVKMQQLKPALAKIIDGIKPEERFPLFLATYPFGANVVEKGTLMVPSTKGKIVPIFDKDVDPTVKSALSYCSIPLCIWLNTMGEVYVEMEERKIPLNIFHPGMICGLWEALDPPELAFSKRIWSIAVGSKTIFTLPKISDIANIKKIDKKYNLHGTTVPKNLFEQINLFVPILNQKKMTWSSEILFFSKGWLHNNFSTQNWLAFSHHLLMEEWNKSIYWRNKVTFDLIGQLFSVAQANRNLKPSPYIIDTVMYLIAIGIGASPGFIPLLADESHAPIKQIQQIIIDDYGLKNYIPTIMCPSYISHNNDESSVYYSMQVPTMLGTAPNLKKPHSVLDDMRMVKRLLESLKKTLIENNNSISALIKNIDYEFFHTTSDKHSGIKCTREIPERDPRFITHSDKTRIFCENSSFLRGCIRINKK